MRFIITTGLEYMTEPRGVKSRIRQKKMGPMERYMKGGFLEIPHTGFIKSENKIILYLSVNIHL